VVVDVEAVLLGAAEGGGRVGLLGGDLLAEQLEGALAGAADFFVHVRGPRRHPLVHPITAALAVDDADPFADRVEDEVSLLGDEGALEGEEVAGVGEDGVEVLVAEGLDRLVDGGDLDDVVPVAERVNRRGVALRMTRQHQDPVASGFQAERLWQIPHVRQPMLVIGARAGQHSVRF
jgi:hypothetical protein